MVLIKPKMIVGLLLVFFVFFLVFLAQAMSHDMQAQQKKNELAKKIQELDKNLIKTNNLNQYFKTDDYQRRAAREKLNYRAPGEKVIYIAGEEVETQPKEEEKKEPVKAQPRKEEAVKTQPKKEVVEEATMSIPQKWWRSFFVGDSNNLTYIK